jgi:hypothetical protein
MTTSSTRTSTDPTRKYTMAAGLLYIATFVFSIPALPLYDDVVNNPDFVLGAGSDTPVLWGAMIEVLTGLAGIGTALALYPILRRYSRSRALGFATSRTLEAAMIFTGVLSVLSVVTLRQDFTGTDTSGVLAAASALVALKNWSFLLGPGLMAVVNALCLATVLYQTRLVPRIIPTIGLVGAPVLLMSGVATLFGAWDQVSGPALLFALPIAVWEFSLGVWMTVKGFRQPASTEPVQVEDTPVPEMVAVG